MYHAVVATLKAHSLLASLPEVDADRIGAIGISWGGVVVANVAGVDRRLKFAVPVYGAGFIAGEEDDDSSFVGQRGTAEQRAAWSVLWDPANYLPAATMPMLWLSGADDFAFTPKARHRSLLVARGKQTLSQPVKMPHTHGPISESAEIIHAFADHVFMGRPSLADVGRARIREDVVMAEYSASIPIRRADLNYTLDQGRWRERQWLSIPADIGPTEIRAGVPEGVTACYFNVIDERGLLVSGRLEILAP